MSRKKLTTIGDRCCMPSDSQEARPLLIVIGDPASRRMSLLKQAAAKCDCEIELLSYADALQERWPQSLRSGAIVRLESPGDGADVTRLILNAGIEPLRQRHRFPVEATTLADEPMARGEILHPFQWFLGYVGIARRLDALLSPLGVRWMNSPESIITAFDKQACRDLWQHEQVPIAPGLAGIKTYQQLRKAVPDRHARLFVKLRYGFSAMGAVALEWRGDLVRAITTTEVVWNEGRPRLFVSKRPRVLQREFDVAWLIDTLAMEQIVVEDWLTKARWRSRPFDLRIVTVGGKARHVVGRASSSPFTNLNLDGDRISQSDLEREIESWPDILALAERAARCFSVGRSDDANQCESRARSNFSPRPGTPERGGGGEGLIDATIGRGRVYEISKLGGMLPDSPSSASSPPISKFRRPDPCAEPVTPRRGAWQLGMDVLLRPCRRRAVVLEANAFGDNLPGLLWRGATTYEVELKEFLESVGCDSIATHHQQFDG